jgi:hypothetical protein
LVGRRGVEETLCGFFAMLDRKCISEDLDSWFSVQECSISVCFSVPGCSMVLSATVKYFSALVSKFPSRSSLLMPRVTSVVECLHFQYQGAQRF